MSVCILLLAAAVRFLYWSIIGTSFGSDSPRYTDAARILLANHGNPLKLVTIGQPIYFWLYPMIITFLGGNTFLVIIFQIFLHALAAVLIYKTGKLLFNRATGIIAGITYAVFWEIFQWDVYILTDSIFLFIVVALFYSYISFIYTKQSKYLILIIGLLIASLLDRPHGLVVTIIFALGTLAHLPRRLSIILGVISCIVVAVYIFSLNGSSVNHNTGSYMQIVSNFYKDGVVIDGRPIYNISVSKGDGSIVNIVLHRLYAFWFVYPVEFTLAHKLLNALFMIPLYIFGIFGVFSFYKRLSGKRFILILMISFIVLYSLAVATSNVDYDWRLRLPVWPFVILLASYGFSSILTLNKSRRA